MICLVALALFMPDVKGNRVIHVNQEYIVALDHQKEVAAKDLNDEKSFTYVTLSHGERPGVWVKGSPTAVRRHIEKTCALDTVMQKEDAVTNLRVARNASKIW